MIWVRRTVSVLLGVTLLPTLFAALVLLRLNDTFLNPVFYPDQFREAGVYQFVTVDVLASVIDDARGLEFGPGENPVVMSGLTTPQIVDAANRALPPDRLEEMASPVLLMIGEYIAAERDDFTITILASEHSRAALRESAELLREAEIYALLLERELEPRIRKALADDESVVRWGPYLFESPEAAAGRLTKAAMRILTPERLRGQVEAALHEATPYLLGESDGFEIRVRPTDTEMEAAVKEAKSILRETDAYNLIFEQEVEPRIRAVYQSMTASQDVSGWTLHLFGTVEEGADRLVQSVKRIAPPEWRQILVESALDEVTPYLTGRADSFVIRVRLSDAQVEAAVEEAKSILREADAYDIMYGDVIEPAVRDSLGQVVSLPYGVKITDDEVVDILRQAAPPSWVQQQAELLTDDVAQYLAGRRSGFSKTVSLADNKRRAERAFAELVERKLAEAVYDLPACRTRTETLAASISWVSLPACIPHGTSAADIIRRSRSNLVGSISPLVLSPITDRVTFTDSNLRTGLMLAGGPEALDLLDDGRRVLGEGWAYSSADLRAEMADVAETMDRVRALLTDGYVYTHENLRAYLAGRGGGTAKVLDDFRDILANGYVYTHEYHRSVRPRNPVLRNLDDAHRQSVAARRFQWAPYVLTPVLLLVIGFLGGRSWLTRAGWASAFLLVSAIAAFAAAGPFYDAIFAPGFDRAYADVAAQSGGEFGNTFTLIADKLKDILGSLRSEFVRGVHQASLIIAAAAAIVLVAALSWKRIPPTTKA